MERIKQKGKQCVVVWCVLYLFSFLRFGLESFEWLLHKTCSEVLFRINNLWTNDFAIVKLLIPFV